MKNGFEESYNNYEVLHKQLVDYCLKGIFVNSDFYHKVEVSERVVIKKFFDDLKSNELNYEEYLKLNIEFSVKKNDYTLMNFIIKLAGSVKPNDISVELCQIIEKLTDNEPVDSFRISLIELTIELLYSYKNPVCVGTIAGVARIKTIDEVSAYAIKAMALLAAIGTEEAKIALTLFKFSFNEDIAEEAERVLKIW